MTNSTERELERVLLRRQDVLEALVTRRRTKPELVGELDVPRSTLDDIVRDLSDAGLVEYVDGNWQATPVGSCAWEIYQSYAARISSLADASTVLSGSPVQRLDCAMLDGCTVYEDESALLDGVIREFTDRLRTAEHLRGLVPQALAGYIPAVDSAIEEDDTTRMEMVFDPAVYEDIASMYPEEMGDALERSHITHYRTPLSRSYGLWIADDNHVGAVVYGDSGVRGILVNDSDAALAWARETYEAARDAAEEITELPE